MRDMRGQGASLRRLTGVGEEGESRAQMRNWYIILNGKVKYNESRQPLMECSRNGRTDTNMKKAE